VAVGATGRLIGGMRPAPSLLVLLLLPAALAGQRPAMRPPFRVDEATIAGMHAALRAGTVSCRQLVQAYLDRIAAYDQQGPALTALVTLNPDALATADSLDAARRGGVPMGALHCVPLAVKDNMETRGLQTTAGSLALAGWRPVRDATQVARVRAAGAIVLAMANLAEWAFTPYETVSSILPGYTRNPYALDRVTAGSSGGTAAAVAASLAAAGLGTEPGNSIRGPSAHTALGGIRSTLGLTARAGVTAEQVHAAFDDAYGASAFVRYERERPPETAAVYARNFAEVHAALDPRTGTLTAFAAIDNLVKGAAGQAVQNLNALLGLEGAVGLLPGGGG
jgi:hypothetical protein